MRKSKKALIAILIVLLGILLEMATVITFAYFSKKEIYDGYFSGEVELLFDRLDDEGITAYQTYLDNTYGDGAKKVTASANWGSEAYPYVISDVRHLYNLSELQRLGYFYNKYISENTATDYTNIPYFLVCTPQYTPALIDGSNFKGITSIGTDQYPFIGSIRGVKGTASNNEWDVNGKKCDTSAIYNVKVSGNPANADVGLFGNIGYLGDSSDTTDGIFTGQVSTVSNLVLVDIRVTVKSDLWGTVTAFLEDIAINTTGGHRYSFTDLYNSDNYNKVPHENHHIGILAGHAVYAKVEYISVYYSADDIVAIDLHDQTDVGGVKANYLSSTGILGFIDNINPTYTEDANGNQSIVAGSGDSVDGISYGQTGGGGLVSGIKAGYVLASNIYNTYHWTASGVDESGTVKLIDALDNDGNALCTEWIRDRILWGTQNTGRYYFYDGVFTFALSDKEDVLEPTWNGAADEFSIGPDDDSAWKVNTEQGNKAVVAYVNKITSNSELNAAISAGKQIFIMQESEENIFLMSLYAQSEDGGSGAFEDRYSTNGIQQQFDSDGEFVQSIINDYNNGKELSGDILLSKDELISKLESYKADPANSKFRVINVGITSSNVSLDDLKRKYKITASTTGEYSYFDENNTPVQVNNDGTNDGTLNDYYKYPIKQQESDIGYDGYLYYTVSKKTGWLGIVTYTYTYFWQTSNNLLQLGNASDSYSSSPSGFSATTDTWEGETIYSYTYNDTTYTGVVVNKSEGKFYNTGNTANANGASLTKPSNTTVEYFYKDIGDTIYYYSKNNEISFSEGNKPEQTGASASGQPIYTYQGVSGVLLERYPTYTFSAEDEKQKTNYLRILQANFGDQGVRYALWNGPGDALGTPSNFKHDYKYLFGALTGTATASGLDSNNQATLIFATDDSGTCYIQYAIGNIGLYVNSTGSAFNTATSNTTSGTKLCIYTVEGTQDLAYGRITLDPKDGTDSHSFSAGGTVLFATSSHTNDTNGYIASTTTSYEVMSLSGLSVSEDNPTGWQDGYNKPLTSDNLQKKFKMTKGITFGRSFNMLNGTLPSEGIITAPVGTNGVEANIPMGCVAFRVNKASKDIKIRVIVSVAVSEFYKGEEGYNLDYIDENGNTIEYTRYFNLWKMEEAGESTVQVFEATGENLLDRFEVPRSHLYNPREKTDTYEYITVKYNGATYRCYLNGDRVLIAYEFNVNSTTEGTGTGVYCLGMSGIGGGSAVENVPMEIVYFSADGVASAGRDGENASQIGTIDFVYDYNELIVTVTEQSNIENDGTENYSNYYPSYCLMYFDTSETTEDSTADNPTYIPVNYENVIVRRYVIAEGDTPTSDVNHNTTTSRSTIKATLGGDGKVKIVQYSRYADNVQVEYTTSQAQNE